MWVLMCHLILMQLCLKYEKLRLEVDDFVQIVEGSRVYDKRSYIGIVINSVSNDQRISNFR